ncbi:MAG: transglutaminase domain-containing protein [Bacteroidales bacterium]|nr:transglutaminase domain-containing protein [Bacteroidales bacterium]
MIRQLILLIFGFLAGFQLAFADDPPDWSSIESTFRKEKSAFREIADLAEFIDQNFRQDEDKTAALYWWLGNNITYDMQAYRQHGSKRNESPQMIIERTFKQRKGVCEGYAGIMDSVLQLLNIKSYTIGGYTRQGQMISPIPHAWVAAKIDRQWMLFDPTWAAGSIINKRYEARFDPAFFMVKPEQMRHTHMPYDPIWQFSELPLSHQAFILHKFDNKKTNASFHFADSIATHIALDLTDQMLAEYQRIHRDYFPHEALNIRLKYLSDNLEISRYNREVELLNQATTSYNNAVENYNQWLEWQQHNGPRHTSTSDQLLLDSGRQLANSLTVLAQLQQTSFELGKDVRSLNKAVNSLKKQLEKEGLRFE